MTWVVVAVLALLIPILAVVLDFRPGQVLADRISGDDRREGAREPGPGE